jgi:hypothetical protein
VSVVLGIFAAVFRRKHRRMSANFAALADEKEQLTACHNALLKEHAQFGVRIRDLMEERDHLADELKAAKDERDQLSRDRADFARARTTLGAVGGSVAEVLRAHKHGPMVANAIRAVAKRKGVLPEFEALLSSSVTTSSDAPEK